MSPNLRINHALGEKKAENIAPRLASHVHAHTIHRRGIFIFIEAMRLCFDVLLQADAGDKSAIGEWMEI
jgi:hypothetical protein